MRKFLVLCLSLLTFFIAGCGFHLRSGREIPQQLHTLYFDPASPNDEVSSQLKDTLTSLNIKLVDLPQQATYTLTLSKPNKSHSQANLSNTSQAASITYTQSVNVGIINNKTHKRVIDSGFAASVSQFLNQNQIMTASTTSLATQDLPHELVTHIFIWLTTNEVREALNGKH